MNFLPKNAPRGRTVRAALVLALVAVPSLGAVRITAGDVDPASLHMVMTPVRPASAADVARADSITYALRGAIAKYRDTSTAVADGYKMFAPQIRQQKVYHFTNSWLSLQEAFRFDPKKPTSLLYEKDAGGNFVLVGAMYTAPKRFTAEQLDARVPLSVARWHKHVNWCIPPRGQVARWLERKDGHPVFGPESPIATRAECDAVRGVFHQSIFGWMVHANVFAGNDSKSVWGDEHAGPDMHEGMKMDGSGV